MHEQENDWILCEKCLKLNAMKWKSKVEIIFWNFDLLFLQ